MTDNIILLELLSARMFHDLAGPIGAINNSLEFFDEDDEDIKEKALNILRSSAKEAIVRLKFLRQAYGTIEAEETLLSNVFPIISDFLENTKLKFIGQDDGTVINNYISKAVLNFVIIGLNAMIHGGEFLITHKAGKVSINLKAHHIILTEETKLLLTGDLTYIKLTSTNVQVYYTYMILQTAKANLTINKHSEGLELIIT